MPKTTQNLNDFTAGELTPRLLGRTDSEKYHSGCAKLQNFGIWAHGGVFKRPGSNYISTAGDLNNQVRLIPYVYSETVSYNIELGNEYARFYINGGQIVVSSGSSTAYEIATPFTSDQLREVKFVQNADIMYLAHGDVHPQKLTRLDHNSWTIEDVPFLNGPFLDENTTAITVTPDETAVSSGVILTCSSGIFTADHVGSVWKITGTQTTAANVSAEENYTDSVSIDLSESFIASVSGTWAGTVTLQRSTNDGVDWSDVYTYPNVNENVLVTESLKPALYSLGILTGDYTSGTAELTLTRTNMSGYVDITAYTSPTSLSGTIVSELPSTAATTQWSEGAWSDERGYPSCVALFEEHSLWAGSAYKPQTFWASQLDDYENMEPGVNADDAYTYTLASNNIDIIQSMLDAGGSLHIFTIGAEWRVNGGQAGSVTPTNIQVKRETTYGSTTIQPLLIGNAIIFVQKGGRKLRQKYYSFDNDSWRSDDISIISEHLLRDGIVEIAYASQPEPTIYLVREGGDLVGISYDTSQDLIAYYNNVTNGEYESVAVIPGPDRDELWACAKRTTDSGTDTRFIEQSTTTLWDTLVESTYLDSSLDYAGVPTATVSGLDHLEGLSVGVTVSGAVHPNVTVSGGAIVLDNLYEQVTAGLRYTAILQTMSLEAPTVKGTSHTKLKHVAELYVKFYNTLGGNLGPTEDDYTVIPSRNSGDLMNNPPALITGDKRVDFPKGYDRDIKITYVSDQPVPAHILAIIPDIRVNTT